MAKLEKRAEICDFLSDGVCTLEGGPSCKYLTEAGCTKSAASENQEAAEAEQGEEPESPETPPVIEEPERSQCEPENEEEKRQMLNAERGRQAQIREMCRTFGMDEQFLQRALGDGKNSGLTIDGTREAIMAKMAARQNAGFSLSMGMDESEKVRRAAGHGLLLRCGVAESRIGKVAAGANDYRSMSLREMCRDFLRRSGQSLPSNPLELVGRALTTTDFPALLTESVNRVLLDGWQLSEVTWDKWCGTGEVADFRPNKAVGFDVNMDLPLVPEGGEYSYGRGTEYAEEYTIATYGKIFPITRQAIINDDLGAFTSIARMHGAACARKINALAYAVLTANAAMRDSKALFHADHSNLYSSAGGTPDVTKLGNIVKGMKLQKNSEGEILAIPPKYFIAPVALESAAEKFFRSDMVGTEAEPNVTNIYGGSVFERVYEPLLDGTSSTDWYMAAAKGMTVNVYFLAGASSPRLEESKGWSVDGVEYKVSIDAGAKAIDWHGLAKSAS